MADLFLKEAASVIRRLSKMMTIDKGTKKFLEQTKNDPSLHRSTENSPEGGFHKILRLLREEPIARIKYLNVWDNIPEKENLKDLWARIRTLPFFAGSLLGIRRQFRVLPKNAQIPEDGYKKVDPAQLWIDLNHYAKTKWGIPKVGFTEIPQDMIIKGRRTLYQYALVIFEEMRKDRIDDAPHLMAGMETIHIYSHLGRAVIDIAKWLQNRGMRCQPNHPLLGLVSYVPLAAKAGLGWQGMNGLLITPEFGQRQRIAPIYLETPLFPFTDTNEHRWVEEYCTTCKKCQTECPPEAILDKKVVYNDNVTGIGQLTRCIDPIKCFPYFNKFQGCSICVKVCPFSVGNDVYVKLKKKG